MTKEYLKYYNSNERCSNENEVLNLARVIDDPKGLILETAQKILCKEGYAKLSMRNIAKEAGLAVGTIYNYYSDKKDLIVDMMEEYWKKYFKILKEIEVSEEDFYLKLRKIFHYLQDFIANFREIWLRVEFYNSKDYVEAGIAREEIYIDKYIKSIELLLIKEIFNNKQELYDKISPKELSEFISMNLMALVQMKNFNYDSFEKVLKIIIGEPS